MVDNKKPPQRPNGTELNTMGLNIFLIKILTKLLIIIWANVGGQGAGFDH